VAQSGRGERRQQTVAHSKWSLRHGSKKRVVGPGPGSSAPCNQILKTYTAIRAGTIPPGLSNIAVRTENRGRMRRLG